MYINIHNLLKNEYEQKRIKADSELNERRLRVYSEIPEIEDIDRTIKAEGLRYNRMILKEILSEADRETAYEEFISTVDGLKGQRLKLLLGNGLPADYLEPDFHCKMCCDTGFVSAGNVLEKCSCYRQKLIDNLYSQSNLKLSDVENFSNFREELYPDKVDESRYGIKISPRENIIALRERCMEFIQNFELPETKNLFFSGRPGVGKTFMSNCVARELLEKGITVLYQTAPVLFDIISRYKTRTPGEDDNEDSGYKNIFDVELLIIDDLGTERQTATRYAELLTILNTRQINNAMKPCKTIISTNIGVRQLFDFYTERVASRIKGCFEGLMFAGEDLRTVKPVRE